MAALLYLGSGFGLGMYRVIFRRAPRARLAPGEWPWLAGAVLAGGVAGPVLLMTGLRGMHASDASLLLNAEGVFTALLAWFAFRENFDRHIATGMVFIVAGTVILSWPGAPRFSEVWPALAVLGACFAWGAGQQSDPQGFAGGRNLDRLGQGARGRRDELGVGLVDARGMAAAVDRGGRLAARLAGLWGQPQLVCGRPASFGHRPNRRLFLGGAVLRIRAGDTLARGTRRRAIVVRRDAYGPGSLATPDRATQPRASPRVPGARTRAYP